MKVHKIYFLTGLIFFFIIIFWISSCRHNADLYNLPEVCFEKDVLPIFQNNCAISGCHNGSGESGLVLNNYVSISHAVDPGNPYSSQAYNSIISTFGEKRMPPAGPLTIENRTIIRVWIEQGARLTTCPDTSGQNNGYVNLLACFSRDILPVLNSKCATSGCHDQISHKEGYVFSSYSSTMMAVTPGNPSESKLYEVIKYATGEEKMPPVGKTQLTSAEIDSIYQWISYGAMDQYCGETCDTVNPITFSGTIWPIMQTSCTGCHSGASPQGGIALANYANVSAAAANGSLINSLKGNGVTKMPLGSSFSACRIRQFEIWVSNGYLNN
jgi:hypothetical protein